ncbi:hypothetical protein SGPA1_40991 [Streptomyces misionensis JCM 4497]
MPLTREQRAEYERLCAELARVERGGVTAADPTRVLPAA